MNPVPSTLAADPNVIAQHNAAIELVKHCVVQTATHDGREIVLAHKDMVDKTVRADGRKHTFTDLASLVAWMKANGNPEDAAVFVSDTQVIAMLSEKWLENISTYKLVASKARKRWTATFNQENLIKHVQAWEDEIVTIGGSPLDLEKLVTNMQMLELGQKTLVKSRFVDRNTLSFEIKLEEDTKSVKIPKDWLIRVPVFEGGTFYDLPLTLQYKIPQQQDQAPVFWFECVKLDSILEQAIDDLQDEAQNDLGNDWLIYRGSPAA